MMERPFSQACENNKAPILEVLEQHLREPGRLLEIGSGTGQHAAWMSSRLPHIRWQPSDLPDALPGINTWLGDADNHNAAEPIVLDVRGRWPERRFDYLFTANTFHIMDADSVGTCIERGAAHLSDNGLFMVYGPFLYRGKPAAEGNIRFDAWLRRRDPRSGIRHFDAICERMLSAGLELERDHEMPANNRLLVFRLTS